VLVKLEADWPNPPWKDIMTLPNQTESVIIRIPLRTQWQCCHRRHFV